MYNGPAGFYKAPVAKVFLGLTAGASFLSLSSPSLRHQWSLSYQALFAERHLWRLIPASLAFQSLPELVFGLFLLYVFRLFERQLGSSKYAVFVLFSHLGSSLLEAALLYSLGPRHSESESVLEEAVSPSSPLVSASSFPAPGPYGLIFACFVLYAWDVPATTRFTLFQHLSFTDKALLYIAGLQLLLCTWSHSLAPGLCGLCMGLLFRCNFLGIRRSQVPAPVVAAASHYLSFVLSQPPAPASSSGRPAGAGAPGINTVAPAAGQDTAAQQGPRGGVNYGVRPGMVGGSAFHSGALAPPFQEAVDQLLAMGFDRDSALRALAQARNDLTLATNILLESQHLG